MPDGHVVRPIMEEDHQAVEDDLYQEEVMQFLDRVNKHEEPTIE